MIVVTTKTGTRVFDAASWNRSFFDPQALVIFKDKEQKAPIAEFDAGTWLMVEEKSQNASR